MKPVQCHLVPTWAIARSAYLVSLRAARLIHSSPQGQGRTGQIKLLTLECFL